jgi:DNA-directed RNA polymerase
VASLGKSLLRHLGIVGTATNLAASRRPKTTAETASGTAAMTVDQDEDEEPVAKTLDHPPTVSLVSKEQAVKLLKPVHGRAKRAKGAVAPEVKSAPEDSLEGTFIDIADLIPSVPLKGEFDVNKIKSSLYFFS